MTMLQDMLETALQCPP